MPLVDGGTQRLPRIVGLGRALDMILTGRIVEADEALAMGLLSEVVPEGAHLERALEIAEALARFPQDTMLLDRGAAIQGSTLPLAEGLELALWCDLRIAAENSRFGFTERRFGVPLVDGGTQRLPRIVGLGRALDIILTGRILDAEEALEMGMLTEVVPAGAQLERALEMAEALAAFPQRTMLADRRAAIDGLGMPLDEGLELEAESGALTFADALAGANRFAAGEGRGGAGAGA